MNTATRLLILSALAFCHLLPAQEVSGVYKIRDLLQRIRHPDTLYVVNFWATWCKPCIQELPAFDSLQASSAHPTLKVLLVSLDFKEDLAVKTNPFLKKKAIRSECVLLDEVNGNTFINQLDPRWTGAIPATLIKYRNKQVFLEKKTQLSELLTNIEGMR